MEELLESMGGLLENMERLQQLRKGINSEEFTEMAWQAVASTPDVVKENKHLMSDTEHLMSALLEQENGLAGQIFSKVGVDNTRLLEATNKFIQCQPEVVVSLPTKVGDDLDALFQRARDCKKEYGDSLVSVEHLQ